MLNKILKEILFLLIDRVIIKTDIIEDNSLILSFLDFIKEQYKVKVPIIVKIDNTIYTNSLIIYFINKPESLEFIKSPNEIVFTTNEEIIKLYPRAILLKFR